jgi:hypothetical protein
MALDPSIALQYKGIEVPNQLAQYSQVAQIQAAQNQNQVGQMQLDQMKRDEATLQQIQAKAVEHGGPSDLNEIANAYIKSGNPKFVEFGVGLRQKLDEKAQFAKIMGLGQPAAAIPTPSSAPAVPSGALGSGTFGITPEPTNALAPKAAPAQPSANALVNPDIAMLRQKRDALLAMGTPQAIAAARALDADISLVAKDPTYHVVPGVGLVDPRTGRVVTPSVETAPSEVKEYEYAKKQGYQGSLFDFKRQMAAAGRAAATPSAPVAVVDPVTGKQVYVSREEAISKKMAPAAAMENLPPKEIQKREAALPQATSAIKGFEVKSDSFVKDLERLRDHPGLNQITGLIAGRAPALTADGRAAQALYDKVVAKGGFQALQDLRDASKTGGALGNVSNQEGKQLTASFSAIDRRQDAKDVKAAIEQAIGDVQGAKTRMREAYDSTYSYKSGGVLAAPTAKPAAPSATGATFLGFE